jgi:hypothetical protein
MLGIAGIRMRGGGAIIIRGMPGGGTTVTLTIAEQTTQRWRHDRRREFIRGYWPTAAVPALVPAILPNTEPETRPVPPG